MRLEAQDYIFERNYELLKKRHPHIVERLRSVPEDPIGKVVKLPNAELNLKIDKNGQEIYLHPEHDPERDCDALLQLINKDFSGVEIIIGMGFGYAAKEIIRQRETIRYLVLIEPDPRIFLQALKWVDLADLLNNPKIVIGVGIDNPASILGEIQKAIAFEDTQILDHQGLAAVDKALVDQAHKLVYDYVNSINIAGSTKVRYGKKIVTNRFLNLKSLGHFFLFEKLVDKFKGVPAFIVAAGPSLDKDIHHLKRVQNKALIICVDTVLPALLEEGIQPHFVCSIDYKDDTYEKFSHKIDDIPEQTGLITYSWASPKVIKNFPGEKKFFLMTDSGIDNWMNTLVSGSKRFASGGSVANLNFVTAFALGCSPIIFVGQDLAYGSGMCHSKGTVLKAHDKMNKSLEGGEDLVWLKGVDGDRVPSSRDLKGILDFFEKLIKHNSGNYINCSSGGAHINGTRFMPLPEAVDQYCPDSSRVNDILSEICREKNKIKPGVIAKNIKKDMKSVSRVLSLVRDVDGKLTKMQKKKSLIKKRWKKTQTLPPEIQTLLSQIDTLNGNIDNYSNIWLILEDYTSKALKESEQMLFEIEKIKEDRKRYPEWIEKNVSRLIYINSVRKESLIILKEGIEKVICHIEKEAALLEEYSKNKTDIEIIQSLAELYVESGDYGIAEKYVENYYVGRPDSAKANYLKGCMSAQKSDVDKMNSYFSVAVQKDPQYDQPIRSYLYDFGRLFLESAEHFKDFDSVVARSLLIKGFRYCPFHGEIHAALEEFAEKDIRKIDDADVKGKLEGQRRVIEGWIHDLTVFPQLIPFVPDKWIGLLYFFEGKLHFKSGQKEEASISFNKSFIYTPENSDQYLRVADMYLCAFDYDIGIFYLNKAIQLDSKHAVYWEPYGDFLFEAGKEDEGVTAYEQAYQFFPENNALSEKIAGYYLQKANQFHQNDEFRHAIQVYDKGISFLQKKNHLLSHLYNNKGSALKNLGENESAMDCYDKALSVEPGYAEALYNKGDLLQSNGDFESALSSFEAAVKSLPDFGLAYQRMGEILVKMGRHKDAEPLLKRAKNIS